MNKNVAVLLIGILLFTLPVLALFKVNSYNSRTNQSLEKCSPEVEGLKLCIGNPTIVVDSDKLIRIKLFWVNSSVEDREIMKAGSYPVKITDEQGEQVDPVFQQKIKTHSMTKDYWGKRPTRGSYTSIFLAPNQTMSDEIWLTENYDYDLSKKGKYSISIRKTVPSLEEGKTIEFVIDNIEIKVK